MEKPEEPTAVIRMKQDFEQFLSGSRHNRSGLQFNLDQDITENHEKEKKDLMLKDVDMKKAQCEINKLKSDLMSEQTSRKRSRLDFEKDLEMVQSKNERLKGKLRDLKSKLSVLCDREEGLIAENEELRTELMQTRKQQNERMSVMHGDVSSLKQELQQTKDVAAKEQNELCIQLFQVQSEHRSTKSDLEEFKALLELQKNSVKDLQTKTADLNMYKAKYEKAECRIKELEFKISQSEEDAAVNRSMRGKLLSVSGLEKTIQQLKEENNCLREYQGHNALLKEQLENMKWKLEMSEGRLEGFSLLESENEELKGKLKKWEEIKSGTEPLGTPSQLNQRLKYLQESQAVILEKNGELQSHLNLKDEALKKVSQTHENVIGQLSTEKTKTQQQIQFVKKLQKKLLLISKERDMYKSLIDSYQSDVTVNISSTASSRIQQLEEILENYRIESMETEMSKIPASLETSTVNAVEAAIEVSKSQGKCSQSLILQLRERIAFLEKELEKTKEDKCTLETRIEQKHLQGDYDPTKLKVLHFTLNPAAVAQKNRAEELTKLKEENERLRKRVEVLGESKGQAQDLTLLVDQKMSEASTSSKEVEEVKKMLETEELKNKRLLEVFKKTSQELREVCYHLMGYKIDMPCANKYKITSLYAESPEDFFMFEQSPGGEVQFLATDFAETLQELIETYISKRNSIPAFLSAVTLELFGRQTDISCS